jgi:CRP/FNR family transcriptional regulator, dissimilatory nitrate respiration regulator
MDFSILCEAPFFRGMSSSEVETALTSVPYRVKKFQAGSMISQSGEQVNSLMIVLSGTVKGEMVDYAGRVIKIEDIPAPGVLASAFIFGKKNRFPVNVIAVSDGELFLIDKPDFLRLMMRNDILLVNFLDQISNRSQFLSEKIKFLNFKTIKGKLAHYILLKTSKESSLVTLDMTQSDLADFFGVARPSVARALGDLEEEGYLEAKGKNIKILNKKGLENLITE